jgi:hypothetical protein
VQQSTLAPLRRALTLPLAYVMPAMERRAAEALVQRKGLDKLNLDEVGAHWYTHGAWYMVCWAYVTNTWWQWSRYSVQAAALTGAQRVTVSAAFK